MNELSDEELQCLWEAENPTSQQPFISDQVQDDATAYQHLFTALKQSPPGSVSPDFSAAVVGRIQSQQHRSANRQFYALLGVLFLAGLTLSVAWVEFFNDQGSEFILQTLYQTKAWLFFGLACLVVIQLLDHHLIKKQMNWHS